MKPTILILFLIIPFSFSQCKKTTDPLSLLPPVTSTGANTFGCLVDGRALMLRDGVPNFDNPYPHKGVELVFDKANNMADFSFYNARDNASEGGFFLDFHLVDFYNLKPGNYNWKQSSYGVGTDPYPLLHVYGSLYDRTTKNYAWFGSYEGSGTITITRIDTANYIIASTFSGKLRKRDGTNEITITDGRFDINWSTVNDKKFP